MDERNYSWRDLRIDTYLSGDFEYGIETMASLYLDISYAWQDVVDYHDRTSERFETSVELQIPMTLNRDGRFFQFDRGIDLSGINLPIGEGPILEDLTITRHSGWTVVLLPEPSTAILALLGVLPAALRRSRSAG